MTVEKHFQRDSRILAAQSLSVAVCAKDRVVVADADGLVSFSQDRQGQMLLGMAAAVCGKEGRRRMNKRPNFPRAVLRERHLSRGSEERPAGVQPNLFGGLVF